jgi:hypothetical protein
MGEHFEMHLLHSLANAKLFDQHGNRCARAGWNGKDMYVCYQPGYATKVLPPDAPEIQRTTLCRAFFAGAGSVFEIVMQVGDGSDGESLLSDVDLELGDVARRVRAGGF